ncbi:MAG: hypothetical protein WCQ21_03120 [Verrucomicrobiota bacterium]|jgi:hypothetical protein
MKKIKTYKPKAGTEIGKLTSAAGGLGLPEKGEAEVEGKNSTWVIHCWYCPAMNQVNPSWDFFICRCCGQVNWKR